MISKRLDEIRDSSSCAVATTTSSSVNPSLVDKLQALELGRMSVRDRAIVQEEIHGVSCCAAPEDERRIEEGLGNLEGEIRTIRKNILFDSWMDGSESSAESSTTAASSSSQGAGGGAAAEDVGGQPLRSVYSEEIWPYLALPEDPAVPDEETRRVTRRLYSYVSHRDFRLKFLRADMYHTKKAAHRYLRCLECLLKYFGPYALQRQLRYSDLGKEEQRVARAGYVQILASRDRAGRLLVVSQPPAPNNQQEISVILRLSTYLFGVVSEDVETQKRGAVLVFSTNEEALQVMSDPANGNEYRLYREGSPVRRSCTHFCLPENSPKMRLVRAVMMTAMTIEDRVRTRIHMGGLTPETQKTLKTFGIPVSELPITSTGAIKTKYHLQWVKSRKAIDMERKEAFEECFFRKSQAAKRQRVNRSWLPHGATPTYDEYLRFKDGDRRESIVYPMPIDVLFCKGSNVKNARHYGNIEFADLMKRSSLAGYQSGGGLHRKNKREAIRQDIIDEVKSRGGRFLTLDEKFPGGHRWFEIESGMKLHDRVAASLYDHKCRPSRCGGQS